MTAGASAKCGGGTYSFSTGPADFCGVFTQQAVAGVIAKLRADGYVAPNKLVIEGISRGALVAGLIAAHDASVAGIVLISGLYDLPQFVADSKSVLSHMKKKPELPSSLQLRRCNF